jgi:hypothetical protein
MPSIRFVFLIAATLAAPAAAAPFTLLRDTIDVRATTVQTFPSIDFLVNASSDTLRIDSASVRLVKPAVYGGQLQIYLIEGSYPEYSLFQGFLAMNQGGKFRFTQETRFFVIPHGTARMVQTAFDGCLACPAAKRQATASASALGDTLKAMVTFHSGNNRDSVLFLSVERNAVALRTSNTRSAPGSTASRRLDPAGRSVRASSRHFLETPAATAR